MRIGRLPLVRALGPDPAPSFSEAVFVRNDTMGDLSKNFLNMSSFADAPYTINVPAGN
jgi:hypothetical protein